MNTDETKEEDLWNIKTYLICQLADSFNEQTDTEMFRVAKGQKYGKPIQFGQVLPN